MRSVLQGVGEAIAERDMPKILMLNGSHDRESSACLQAPGKMAAVRCRLCRSGCVALLRTVPCNCQLLSLVWSPGSDEVH
jgi:hypothetical protein